VAEYVTNSSVPWSVPGRAMRFVCCTAPPPTSSRFRREMQYGGCCPDSGWRWCLGRQRRAWDRPTDRPPAPRRGPGVCGLHRGPGSTAAPVPLRRPRVSLRPPRVSLRPPGLHRGRRSRSAPRIATNAATSGPYGDDRAIRPLDRASLRGRHARIGPPRWPPGLDCGPGPAIRRLTSNICHNRVPAATARSLRAPVRHLPGRLAAQVAPLARRADNVHRHAQRVGHVLEYEIGRADRISGGAEDGVPGFDRSFTMHPRPSACVQDRPGDTSAATRTLTVTE